MNLHVLDGPNFSGRTRRLREWVGLSDDPQWEPSDSQFSYIGPDPSASLSGIAPSVAAEFDLMASDPDAAKEVKKVLDALGFGYIIKQNPFTLSGGEQVVVAILSATAARPKRLAIDCSLEQLSNDTRTELLAYLEKLDGDLLIADNKISEWYFGSAEQMQAASDAPRICLNEDIRIVQEPCEIEIVDLCHEYVKGRPVLKNFNLRLSAGTMYQLKGPNGVGKTTLSKILCGLVKPTSGEVRLNGKVVQPWRRPASFVSYHFQNPDYQLFATSVQSQLSQADKKDAIVRWFGLDGILNAHPLDLPFVLKKRVALATAMKKKAAFLILDEPTLSQDIFSSENIIRLGTTGVSGFIISHTQSFMEIPVILLEKQ